MVLLLREGLGQVMEFRHGKSLSRWPILERIVWMVHHGMMEPALCWR